MVVPSQFNLKTRIEGNYLKRESLPLAEVGAAGFQTVGWSASKARAYSSTAQRPCTQETHLSSNNEHTKNKPPLLITMKNKLKHIQTHTEKRRRKKWALFNAQKGFLLIWWQFVHHFNVIRTIHTGKMNLLPQERIKCCIPRKWKHTSFVYQYCHRHSSLPLWKTWRAWGHCEDSFQTLILCQKSFR